jgi:DNA-binding transcriptional regulator YdaS (Cro superfamily)
MNPHIERAIGALGSQAKLGGAIGVSQQYVSKLLRGKKRITAEIAIKIEVATRFGVSRSDLCPQFWPPAPALARDAPAPAREEASNG